jgi:hypothetical protein
MCVWAPTYIPLLVAYGPARILRVTALLYEAVLTKCVTTKRSARPHRDSKRQLMISRDIYYKDVALFQKQSVVDSVSRAQLRLKYWNVHAEESS